MNFEEEVVRVYWRLMSISKHYFPHDEERAKDLASETVARVLEVRQRYDETKPMLPWCRAIMRNMFIEFCRKKKVYVTDADPVCESDTEMRTMLFQTLSVIRILRYKHVCVDTFVDFAMGYSVIEISNARGLPPGTVKRRVHDARIMLRRFII